MHRGDLAPLLNNDRFKNVAASEMSEGTPLDMFTLDAVTERQGFTLANPRPERESVESGESNPAGTGDSADSDDAKDAKDAKAPSESKASKS
jgi:hypothetical protein